MGKGDRKHKKRRKQARQSLATVTQKAVGEPQAPVQPLSRAVRPTPQRKRRGRWTSPTGMGKHEIAMTDMASDAIGALFVDGWITKGEEQAARTWQELHAAYLHELPDISGYKSCLDGGIPGFDDGDGDPEVIRAYREMEGRMSFAQRREILWVCWSDNEPNSLEMLKSALGVVAGS